MDKEIKITEYCIRATLNYHRFYQLVHMLNDLSDNFVELLIMTFN